MDVKKVVLLVGALIIAGVCAFAVNSLAFGSPAPQAQAAAVQQGPEVLVASESLPVGTIIQPGAIRFQRWPAELINPQDYFIKGQADTQALSGTVVRIAITAGQPITQGALVKPGDRGFLAAALGAGMRAVTVTVNGAQGVSGFVFPGDRVDLMLTQAVSGEGEALKTAETIIRNLRVLATDQTSTPPGTGPKVEGEGQPEVRTYNTVTLEVTPRLAEKIAVAQTLGTLSLSLRSIADNQSELDQAIASGTVKIPAGTSPEKEQEILAGLAAQPIDQTTSYVTGGDVSRFARSTVPRKEGSSTAGLQSLGAQVPFQPTAPIVTVQSVDAPRSSGPATEVRRGPVVRVARGNNVTEVSVGGK